jgi:hypothetical protein
MSAALLDSEAIAAFAPDVKVGLVATVDPAGRPHVSLLTSLCAKDPTHLMWGQFTEGRSKQHVRANPKVGFVVLTLDRKLWRGRAVWTGSTGQGADHQAFNARPMFRYNAYFGVHTVHHLDLVEVSARLGVPLVGLLGGSVLAGAARVVAGKRPTPVFNHWTRRHLAALTTLKFFSWLDERGYPVLVPCVPCQPAGAGRLVFAPSVFTRDFSKLEAGRSVAVFGLNLQTESVLVRGAFSGFWGIGPARVGVIEVDWVYNSMPPVPGQIYPPVPLEAVTRF